MATSETIAVYHYSCPHGAGEFIEEWRQPDHPWSPKPYRASTVCTCRLCSETYDPHFDHYGVGGVPDSLRERGLLFLVEKADVELRRRADEDVERAAKILRPIQANLKARAISELQAVSGQARQRLSMAMFGFPSEGAVKDFTARRRVPTWVPEALRDEQRSANLAAYCGVLGPWRPAYDSWRTAKAQRKHLGDPPMKHALSRS